MQLLHAVLRFLRAVQGDEVRAYFASDPGNSVRHISPPDLFVPYFWVRTPIVLYCIGLLWQARTIFFKRRFYSMACCVLCTKLCFGVYSLTERMGRGSHVCFILA